MIPVPVASVFRGKLPDKASEDAIGSFAAHHIVQVIKMRCRYEKAPI